MSRAREAGSALTGLRLCGLREEGGKAAAAAGRRRGLRRAAAGAERAGSAERAPAGSNRPPQRRSPRLCRPPLGLRGPGHDGDRGAGAAGRLRGAGASSCSLLCCGKGSGGDGWVTAGEAASALAPQRPAAAPPPSFRLVPGAGRRGARGRAASAVGAALSSAVGSPPRSPAPRGRGLGAAVRGAGPRRGAGSSPFLGPGVGSAPRRGRRACEEGAAAACVRVRAACARGEVRGAVGAAAVRARGEAAPFPGLPHLWPLARAARRVRLPGPDSASGRAGAALSRLPAWPVRRSEGARGGEAAREPGRRGVQETLVRFLGQEDPLEKGYATHSSIRLPWWLSR